MAFINKTTIILILVFVVLFMVMRQFLQRGPEYVNTTQLIGPTKKDEPTKKDGMLILYNRIPKTGSTSFVSVLYKLHEINQFSVAYVNVSSSRHRFTFLDKHRFAKNISNWNKRKPGVYHGHFPFLHFHQLGFKQPLYINILRKPLERLVSYYYFVRYGDTFLPNKRRNHEGDTRTFDACVKEQGSVCSPEKLWLQIPYMCGSDPECWVPGSKRALQRAKFNVVNYYFLVGVTEQIGEFVELLENVLPSFFKGAIEIFNENGGTHIRKTKVKKPLLGETIAYFKKSKIWIMENEFYEFVKKNFNAEYKSYTSNHKLQVSYVKVKP